jgi:hypothetical protein
MTEDHFRQLPVLSRTCKMNVYFTIHQTNYLAETLEHDTRVSTTLTLGRLVAH